MSADGCERAVLATYLELRELGTSEVYAFQACVTLYRIHHAQTSADEAHWLVAEWIDRGVGDRSRRAAADGAAR